MKYWWLTNSKRLGNERRAVEATARDEGWFKLARWRVWHGRLCAEGILVAHGHDYPVRLVYPDQFPEVPAWVEPQEDVRWSSHQYGKGTLCLELRPDNWDSRASGADVLRSAHNLLVKENPLGGGSERAPSAHAVGEIQSYGWWSNPVMIGSGCLDRLVQARAEDVLAARWVGVDGLVPLLINDKVDRQRDQRPPGADLLRLRNDLPVFVFHRPPPSEPSDRERLAAAAGVDGELTEALKILSFGVVAFVQDEEITIFNLAGDGTFRRDLYVLPDDYGVRTARTATAATKRVTIVGCGSLGSKVAESLLRSGIHQLSLVDGDVFLPGNLERHALDWDGVGFRKVEAMKARLLAIVPGAKVSTVAENLNWQRSAKTHAAQVEQLAETDVVVDATGDAATGLFLAAIAEANGKAFVTAEVFAGGIGALIATCIPGRGQSFVDGRATFLSWCDAQNVPPPPTGDRGYEMLDDGVPVVADDAAVTIAAGNVARVVLDIVEGDPPPAAAAWLLLGFSRHWLFDGLGHTIRLNVGTKETGPAPQVDDEAVAFITQLLGELKDEADTAK